MNADQFFEIVDGWQLKITKFDPEQLIHYGSNLLCGNGYLGYRGTLPEWGKEEYQACIVSDTYDMADGKWRELSNAPNGLATELLLADQSLDFSPVKNLNTNLSFNYQYGIFKRNSKLKNVINRSSADKLEVESERFASYSNLHLIANKYQLNNLNQDKLLKIRLGIEGDVWDLNGEHLTNLKNDYETEQAVLYLQGTTVESKIDLVTAMSFNFKQGLVKNMRIISRAKSIYLELTIQPENNSCKFERNMVVYSSNDLTDPLAAAIKTAVQAREKEYKQLLIEHQQCWDVKWAVMDIKIKGNLLDQLAIRFNLYHNIIATPAHSEYLPIGARGLSCQAYQGSAFWDQEIFNLPMFLFTKPEIAKNILKYRYHTLDGARKKAQDLGFAGAFYAWISGKTGQELCPDFFFKDMISGRKIRNHFNDWQIHVSPDIGYTIWKYYQVTDDLDFIFNYGAEMLFEIARFIHSRVHYNDRQDYYELIRLLGPDEYHENIDNNVFTNYQSQFVLKKAIYFYHLLLNKYPEELARIKSSIELTETEITAWQRIAEKFYLPEPNQANLLEQFDGYFELEDTTAEVIKKRLINNQEYWGWPNGIAVFTQVIKQADVIQLFTLHDIFNQDILAANYDYYEPRTQHGSSLSPSQYGIIAARIGRSELAYQYFKKSAFIDLMSTNKAVSGGTFIGGIHTAAAGGIWQLIINGFSGFKLTKSGLEFNPALVEEWEELEYKLNYRSAILQINLTPAKLKIKLLDMQTEKPVEIKVKVLAREYILEPDSQLQIKL
ncbi:glycosyl hydrolase family 65 protein [Halanaerobium salsuginis]|jgi:kojibiose phosphorylase|uniref:Kojibiose phosphorylase n=1 Tax=Halanaerobium salsuginis TaxID=29563 RepID=A0A1I4H194_9FIRM|nr:glycosyl hydrolase family 65 protein [Halanaerobium salsuginis]SFL36034.1 kojibiose phosphorylase [Halanaerobium salsuginis]